MLGTFRFSLALLVVLNHTWLPVANKVGAHAVTAFYVISGFLMTKIIHEVYGLTVSGALRYLQNRFLRIFAPYWAFLFLTVVALLLLPSARFSRMGLPNGAIEALRHITLVDVTYLPTAPIPPAWSLSVECFFYLSMVAVLARRESVAFTWLAVSAALTVYLVATGAEFGERYYPVYAASLFFALGSVTYFRLPQLQRFAPTPFATLVLALIFVLWPLLVEWAGGDRLMLGYYGATALFLPTLLGLLALKLPRLQAVDASLGALAYPVFISHMLAAALVMAFFPVTPLGVAFVALTLALTLILSVVSVLVLERTVERLRSRVRGMKF